jgi:hypothetical protein
MTDVSKTSNPMTAILGITSDDKFNKEKYHG